MTKTAGAIIRKAMKSFKIHCVLEDNPEEGKFSHHMLIGNSNDHTFLTLKENDKLLIFNPLVANFDA